MKDQFEKNIKSLVEDFTYDYDPKAWDALAKQLPTRPVGSNVITKITLFTILLSAAGSFWYFMSTPGIHNKGKAQQYQKATKEAPKQVQTTAQQTKLTTVKASEKLVNNSTQANSLVQSSAHLIEPKEQTPLQLNSELTLSSPLQTNIETPIERAANIGWLQPVTRSENKTIQEPSKAQSNNITTPCKEVKIALSAENISYENGYPIVHINAETAAYQLTWSANGGLMNQKNKGADLLAFHQQTYHVSAQASIDECISKETISVRADQNYNLLAVNAFNPQSRDERNARFMPYALTIRDVHFTLTIIDPDNGAVIFNTADAQNAWDGIDQRTGQLINAQKAYIWRVLLENPLPGEKNTYTGTIVRI